jgi:hypothetical protein
MHAAHLGERRCAGQKQDGEEENLSAGLSNAHAMCLLVL